MGLPLLLWYTGGNRTYRSFFLFYAAITTTAFAFAFTFVRGDDYYCEKEPLSSCNTDSTDPATSGCFDASRTRTVFGINIWSPSDVPLWAVDYAESVLNEFLDSDEDDQVDDPNVLHALLNNKHALDTAVLKCRGSIGGGPLKDLFWSITRTYGQQYLEEGDEVGWNYWKRITMEETHHAIHRGLAAAYPDVFGNGLTTDLSLAIDQAYDDCEYPAECAPDCQNYNCYCQDNDNNDRCDDNESKQYDCNWIENSCNGVYHYGHVMGCDFQNEGGGCQGSEGFYWPSTTLLGWQKGDVVSDHISNEWEISTAEELATNPKTKLLYRLVSGQSSSQKQYRYRVPSRLPDGRYMSNEPGRLSCAMFFEKSGCKAVNNCKWKKVKKGLSRCITCTDGELKFKNKEKHNCEWVGRKKTRKRCKKKEFGANGKRIHQICSETCALVVVGPCAK